VDKMKNNENDMQMCLAGPPWLALEPSDPDVGTELSPSLLSPPHK
jgi:hypothetical protein